MDPLIHKPWKDRIFELRMAIRYTKGMFAKVLQVSTSRFNDLELGKSEPNLRNIRRLRLMEKAFSEYMPEYYRLVKKFGSKYTWGREVKVYEKYAGYKFHKRAVSFTSSTIVPSRQEDFDSLGGMATFAFIIDKKHKQESRNKVFDLRRGITEDVQDQAS